MRNRAWVIVVVVVLASLLFGSEAYAQVMGQDLSRPVDAFDNGLFNLIAEASKEWEGGLRGFANKLFWGLALIQFVWTFIPLVFKQADFGEIVGELVRFILVIGFFAGLLIYSSEWAAAIVNSFRQAGASAAGMDAQLSPGSMFGIGLQLAETIGNSTSLSHVLTPIVPMMIALSCIIVLLCFVFIAAFMGVTIIESMIVINASMIFMGFGASQWTREYAIAIMRYAVSVGAKLFILTLLVGLVQSAAKKWQIAYTDDTASMWTMVGLALVCAYFVKTLPELVQGVINGSSSGGGASLGSMAAAGAAGAAAAAATIATAGAAAPAAAAGGTGMAAGGAGAAGSGGLAGAINASFAGQAGATTAGTGAMQAGGIAGQAGGGVTSGVNATRAAAPRIGGGDAASAAGKAAGPKPSAPRSGEGGGIKQAIKAAGNGQRQDEGQSPATSPGVAPRSPGAEQKGITGHSIASAMTRGAGVLSAISVPGMEGAAGLSLGSGTPAPVQGDEQATTEGEGEGNIIRPSGDAAAEVPPAPAPVPGAVAAIEEAANEITQSRWSAEASSVGGAGPQMHQSLQAAAKAASSGDVEAMSGHLAVAQKHAESLGPQAVKTMADLYKKLNLPPDSSPRGTP